MKSVAELVAELLAGASRDAAHVLRHLIHALMDALPDEMRFGTATRGPCSVPFADTPDGAAVRELAIHRPDLASTPLGLHCRGLAGDESIVSACLESALGRTGDDHESCTMALCALGTDKAITALQHILVAAPHPSRRAAAAYALVWHYDDSGRDLIRTTVDECRSIERLTATLFLAQCRAEESHRFVLSLLDRDGEDDVRWRLLGRSSGEFVKRSREYLRPEELRAWLHRYETPALETVET